MSEEKVETASLAIPKRSEEKQTHQVDAASMIRGFVRLDQVVVSKAMFETVPQLLQDIVEAAVSTQDARDKRRALEARSIKVIENKWIPKGYAALRTKSGEVKLIRWNY